MQETRQLKMVSNNSEPEIIPKSGLNPGQIAFVNQCTPREMIRVRRGRGGKQLAYVPHNFVTELLNQAFNHAWSFECDIIPQFCNDNEMTVKGRLIVHGADGRQIVKEQFGNQDILKSRSGKADMPFGDALKGAGSNALRKCASLLGIGLDLYGVPRPPRQPCPPEPKPAPGSGPGFPGAGLQISESQVAFIRKLMKSHVFSDEERQKAESFIRSSPSSQQASKFINSLQKHIADRRAVEKSEQEENPASTPADTAQNGDASADSTPDPLELRQRAAQIKAVAQRSDDQKAFDREMAQASALRQQADLIEAETAQHELNDMILLCQDWEKTGSAMFMLALQETQQAFQIEKPTTAEHFKLMLTYYKKEE